VIVDIRVGSPAFGRCEIVHLAAGEERSVYVPVGVAHGFCVTSDLGALTYLLSSPFNAAFEFEINPFDAEISVPWTIVGEAVVSPKTPARPRFVNAVTRRNFLSFATLARMRWRRAALLALSK